MEQCVPPFDQTALVACPMCGSRHCQLQPIARKAGVVVGGMLGAIIAAGLKYAPFGDFNGAALVSTISRQLPVMLNGIIAETIAGFVRGAIAGHAAGADIDKHVIRIYQCHACGFEF